MSVLKYVDNIFEKIKNVIYRIRLVNRFEYFINHVDLKPISIYKKDCFYPTILRQYIGAKIEFNISYIKKEFENIFIESSFIEKEIDIKDITAVSKSKSRAWGRSFPDMYSFGKSIYIDGTHDSDEKREYLWSFEACKTHLLLSFSKPLEVLKYSWNNSLYWLNSDGSHHLATLIFHAYNNKINYKVNASISTISINVSKVNILLKKYHLFVFNSDNLYRIHELIHSKKVFYGRNPYNQNYLMVIPKNVRGLKMCVNFFIKFDQNFIYYLNPLLKKEALNSIKSK